MKPKILVIDDDEQIRTQMKWALGKDYEVLLAEDRESSSKAFREHRPGIVLLDLGLPPRPSDIEEGMATMSELLAMDRAAKVIIISGQNDRENAMRAIAAGAYDFLSKPIEVEPLKLLLQRCIFVAGLEQDYLERRSAERPDVFEGMLGRSEGMQEVFRTIAKVARSKAPVLILGESGTGKEMVAQAIHRSSAAADGPFVAINCNAIPENLLESELFGYEKGAFTGASSQKSGLIETASGGTLFLDEIGDLPATMQVKLLRFLQERTIQRIGGRKEIKVDARVLAATHVDLTTAIADGVFREDLYFRLAVVVCKLPALRERGGDVLLMARDFLTNFAARDGREGMVFEPDAERAIQSYPWPGNVRELQNRVQRAVIMADERRVRCEDLEIDGRADGSGQTVVVPPDSGLREARETLEREMVMQSLERNGYNVSAAAKDLGISRPTLYELMSKLRISRR